MSKKLPPKPSGHAHRSEHWFVVAGTAVVTLDGTERRLEPGDAIDIALGAAHRIENVGEEQNVGGDSNALRVGIRCDQLDGGFRRRTIARWGAAARITILSSALPSNCRN